MTSLLEQYSTNTFGKNRDESFYGLDSSEQDQILIKILDYANGNRSRFLQELYGLDLTEISGPVALIYEALTRDRTIGAIFMPTKSNEYWISA